MAIRGTRDYGDFESIKLTIPKIAAVTTFYKKFYEIYVEWDECFIDKEHVYVRIHD